MNKLSQRIAYFSQITIYGISLLILFYLMISSYVYVFDISNMEAHKDPLVPALLVFVIVFLVMCVISWILERFSWIGSTFLFVSLLLINMVACSWWIVNSAALPSSDGKSLYDIAVRIINHDMTPIAPVGSYMSLWPFQSGLLLYMETILRFFYEADAMTMQWINLFFVGLTQVSAYFFVKRCFHSVRVSNFWCILMATCFPYFLYVNFVYGDIPSVGFLFLATWMFTEYVQRDKFVFAIIGVLSIGGAIIVRNNSLIFVVACVLLLGVLFILERKKKHIVLMVFLLVVTLAATKLPQKFYEYRANNVMGDGVPTIAYLTMGLQDDGGSMAGRWNGYHSNLMIENNFDAKKTAEISKDAYSDLLENMLKNPLYALDFFNRKLTMQWCDHNFSCLYSTKNLFMEERTQKAWNIYEGDWSNKIQKAMNWHQSIVYTGGFLLTLGVLIRWIRRRRKQRQGLVQALNLWKLIYIITFIGGFLFSMIWEGGSRYVLPYFVMLLPYAAKGLSDLSTFLEEKFQRERNKN